MIALARQPSDGQKIVEAIIRRLPSTHPEYPYYYEHLQRILAGFAGEQRMDAEWLEIELPYPYYFLHGLQMINRSGSTHQIDTIFLYAHFVLILEIKNITGILSYHAPFSQFTRTTAEGVLESMADPFQQVARHVAWIKSLLQQERLDLPVLSAVVIATKNGILTEGFREQPVFHVTGLRTHLQKWLQQYPQSEKDTKMLFRFAMLLLSMHQKITKELKVPLQDIIKGVLCSRCANGQRLRYHYKKWLCPRCGVEEHNALHRALEDYRLLVGTMLTNKSFYEFFAIDSPNIAYKLLQQLPLKAEGTKRHRKYWITH
ncbi:nuclease-related domain-containing protein [Lysinibacillus sp. FSL K6-0232]|uniref:nuclease-related domain-containing protein n=1 Tax=Lysinibacillus sp. FSL K6-0232 TaxID=2921425 RepID=UPI0030F6AC5C